MTAPLEADRDEAGGGAGSPEPAPSGPKPARELLPLVYDEPDE